MAGVLPHLGPPDLLGQQFLGLPAGSNTALLWLLDQPVARMVQEVEITTAPKAIGQRLEVLLLIDSGLGDQFLDDFYKAQEGGQAGSQNWLFYPGQVGVR